MAKTEGVQASVISAKEAISALEARNESRTNFEANSALYEIYAALKQAGIDDRQSVKLEERLEEHEILGNECSADIAGIVSSANEILELVDKEGGAHAASAVDDICDDINSALQQVFSTRDKLTESISEFDRFWVSANAASRTLRCRDDEFDEATADLITVRNKMIKLKRALSKA